jgi:hypothetical protein
MKDQRYYAGRFSSEVDRILEQHARAEEEGPPSEYPELLALAEQLAALDFSQDRPLRPRLRYDLLNQLDAKIAARQRPPWWQRLRLPKPRWAVGALLALVLVALVWVTPTGQAVAQGVERLIRRLDWPHTTVHQLPPHQQPTATAVYQERLQGQPAARQDCSFRFEGHYFDFHYPAGEAVRNEVVSLSQAVAETRFDLQVPTFLPEGWVLSEVRLLCVASFDVFMVYEGDGGRLGLYQSFVNLGSEERSNENVVITTRRVIDVFTNKTLEDVMVGTTRAILIDGESLVWEEDDVSFDLIGPGLGRETLVRVAESLAPVEPSTGY